MSMLGNGRIRRVVSWDFALTIGVYSLFAASLFVPKLTPFAMTISYISILPFFIREWRAGRMTPDRWSDFKMLTAIEFFGTIFLFMLYWH